MKYVLAAIAGVWMADGLALLLAPRHVIARVRDFLAGSPAVLRWEGVAVGLGVILLLGTRELSYQPLWTITGAVMVLKGVFLTMGPEPLRQGVVEWCLRRDEVDYRLVGMGLCTLSVLLLHALGWVGGK